MFFESLGTAVARLGGANPHVLAQVKSAKSRFFQMGLVLLSTAAVAVVSMSFALADGLRARLPVAIALGFVWGFMILNIDRLLIQNLRTGAGIWRTLVMVLTRLIIASLLSIVISTPLVLQVFNPEIQSEMTLNNAKQIVVLGGVRADSPATKQLNTDIADIAMDQATLRGATPSATSGNVTAAQSALGAAQSNLTSTTATAQAAYTKMECELNGQTCDGASGSKGQGPRYEALKQLYQIAETNEADAQQAVATAQKALESAQSAAAQTNAAALAQAQAQANRELPGLIAQRNTLQAELGQQSKSDSQTVTNGTGILARIQALNDLDRTSSAAFYAHWAVAALLFMIELLPVLVKLLMSFGPPTTYDRVSELMDDNTYDAASQQRSIERRRIEQDSKKTREIEDDMRAREVKLGIRANGHVAGKMEEILDVALADWGKQLSQTLNAAAQAPRTDPSGGAPASSGGHNGQASQAAIRSQYNLPNGGGLK
jgi:hypothetical protein